MKNQTQAFETNSNYDGHISEDDDQREEFLKLIRQAREDWIQAQNYFDNVSDPDLIDYAIYELEAARRKYMYFIKQAKMKNIHDMQPILHVRRMGGESSD